MLVRDLIAKLSRLDQDAEIGFGLDAHDYCQSTHFIKSFKVSEEVVYKQGSSSKVDFDSSIEDYSEDGDYEVSMKYVIHTN